MKKLIMILSALLILGGCCSITPQNNSEISKKGILTDKVLALKAVIDVKSPKEVLFILEVERLKENEEEYLPSSEDFRVEIISKKGVTLWSSNHNRSFLQTIGTVKPVTPGEKYAYKMPWDGLMNNNKKLPEGNYKVWMTIPSRPKAYLIETVIEWKERDE